jgi:hypothetical protein
MSPSSSRGPSEHILRIAHNVVCDAPPLAIAPHIVGGSYGGEPWRRWARQFWRDPVTNQWSSLKLVSVHRGWVFPAGLTEGDVIEFGAGVSIDGAWLPDTLAAWVGYITHLSPWVLVVVGPYASLDDCELAARPRLLERTVGLLPPPAYSDDDCRQGCDPDADCSPW